VLLAGAALGELCGLPFLDELVGGQLGSVELGVGNVWLKPGSEKACERACTLLVGASVTRHECRA
jgi:hypothetical protein